MFINISDVLSSNSNKINSTGASINQPLILLFM